MGLSIGQNPQTLSILRAPTARLPFQAASSRPTPRIGLTGTTPETQVNPFQRQTRDAAPRAGFGEGTISTAGAALITLGRGVRSARELIPTPREIQAQLRERFAQDRAENERRTAERLGRRVELRLPEPSARARNFINELNEAAGAVQARLGGEASPMRAGGASIQVGDETFPVDRRGEQPGASPRVNAPHFDVFA